MNLASSKYSVEVYKIVKDLQLYFSRELNKVSGLDSSIFKSKVWLRQKGEYGGGERLEADCAELFNRASINFSQVNYEKNSAKKLNCATALSTIIHPRNPSSPSIHIHLSFTEFKNSSGFWRIMADLNPAKETLEDSASFSNSVSNALGAYAKDAQVQGDKYFFIPALNRHRGVSHFYLENFYTSDFNSDVVFARAVIKQAIDSYIVILSKSLKDVNDISVALQKLQLDYHTLYFFQVLILDRGTTAGLLVHSENDIGILASLPRFVNIELLQSWKKKLNIVQTSLLHNIILTLKGNSEINENTKALLAATLRRFYKEHPEALQMQATGTVAPRTILNHQ